MKYNSQLYKEYLQSRNGFATHLQLHDSKRRTILQQLIDLPDQPTLTLESSIELLQNLGMVNSIRSIEHLCELSEFKKNSGEGWSENEIQLWECRLISFLWSVLNEQIVQTRDFKQLLMILLNRQQENRQEQIVHLCGDCQQISQLIWAWDHLFKESLSEQEQINDISIIKTKNQGGLSNKQNLANQQNGYQTQRNSLSSNKYGHYKSKSKLEKSYQKKTVKTTIDRNGNSAGRISSKRSQVNNLNNYISGPVSNFYREGQSLTIDDEKRLVDRLYKFDRYYDREEQKRQLDEERLQKELSQCTFKPSITRKSHSTSRIRPGQKNIKGYQKAVERMKTGYQKQKEFKENMEYRVWTKVPEISNKATKPVPPKLHEKVQKQQEEQLFCLKFSLGKTNIPIKVRKSDKIEELVSKVAKIYSLKQFEKGYIRASLEEYLQHYFSENCQEIFD